MKKAIVLIAVTVAAATLVGAAIFFFSLSLPSLSSLRDFRPPVASEVFSDEYIKIGEFFKERRIFLPLRHTPPLLVKAFVAAEDSDFFRHKGISWTGVMRAVFKNLLAGEVKQGGSTITQQVAKGLLLSPERSFIRKFREAVLAFNMEKFLTKEEILELYLNQVYLGHGAYGVQAAAQVYFDKDVASLGLHEMGVLAALTKAPSLDDPFKDPARALNRRNYVIRRMLEESYIDSEQARQASEQPLQLVDQTLNLKYAPYFVEHVRRYLIDKYGEERVYKEGLQVYTTLKVGDALASEAALKAGLEELDRRQGFRGPLEYLEENVRPTLLQKLREEQDHEPKDQKETLKALVVEVKDKEELTVVDAGYTKGVIPMETMRWARKPDPERFWETALIDRPSQALKPGDVIWVRLMEPGRQLVKPLPKATTPFVLFQKPEVQGSIVSLDPQDGAVRAMVGGYEFGKGEGKSEFNRVVQALRQPGSAFKPIIYSAALDHGFTPASIIVDSPIVYDDPTREYKWKPKNYEGDFKGNTIFRECLVASRNVPTVKIVQQLGVETLINYARRIGITSELAKDYSLALGSSALTPLELISVYAVFPTGGRKVTPIFVKKVVDRDGNLLEQNIPDEAALPVTDQVAVAQDEEIVKIRHQEAIEVGKDPKKSLPEGYVMSPQTAYIMTHLLKEVVFSGTGFRASAINRPAAGKTGTTNENNDAWFIGFTPALLAGVWVGFDKATSLGAREMGGSAAIPIWLSYMKEALKDLPITEFTAPAGIVFAQIDPKNGKITTPKTKNPIFEAFREGTEPSETSDEAEGRKSKQNFFLNE